MEDAAKASWEGMSPSFIVVNYEVNNIPYRKYFKPRDLKRKAR